MSKEPKSKFTSLSGEQRRILAQRLMKSRSADSGAIRPQQRHDSRFPLSFAQQRLWFLDRLQPGSTFYNEPIAYRINGSLDISAFKKSLNEIVRRHEALRTVFVDAEGETVQRVTPAEPLELSISEAVNIPARERETVINRFVREGTSLPFDLSKGPLLHVKLLHLGREDHVLLVVMHHIITDGWSMGIFFRELARLYEDYSAGRDFSLPELPIQYADFAVWQRKWLQGEVLEQQLSYWKKQLKGLGVLELPLDRPRPSMQTYVGSHESFVIDQPVARALDVLSLKDNSTLFMTLLGAFQVLLYRYTGQEDIAVGSPIANRNRAEIEGLIGFFVNTLVLRSDLSGNPSFQDLLKDVRQTALDAYMHQDLPFEKLVEELQPERNPSISPLFQVMFVLQNAPRKNLQLGELTMKPLAVENNTAKFDLTLSLVEREGELYGKLEYNTDLFDQTTIQRMIGHFKTLLESVVADPDQRVSELALLTLAERHQLLIEWNTTEIDYPREACLHELFEAQAEKTPDATAVIFAGRQLTYRELDGYANQLARHLQKLGVGPEVPVGICLERSLGMIVSLLGILKAGGAYVPLDPEYPVKRLEYILNDSNIQILLTKAKIREKFQTPLSQVIYIDSDWHNIAQFTDKKLTSRHMPHNLAYVIYTSGSTGQPKGVMVNHNAVAQHCIIMNEHYQLCAKDNVLQFASYNFDASVEQIFSTLICGASLVLVRSSHLSAADMCEKIIASGVTVANFPPAYWSELVRYINDTKCDLSFLRLVIVGGDVLTKELQRKTFIQFPESFVFMNAYGPTEAVVTSTLYPINSSRMGTNKYKTVPIGRPTAKTQLYILDVYGEPVPVNVPGELFIGGENLARGYLDHPGLTAEKFIPDPFSCEPGARLYRTGDLARYRADGYIEFLGRMDHQVKIRGFRIELGEIEAVLREHPQIPECVVVVQEASTGDKRLVAYVVTRNSRELTSTEVRRFIGKKLPEHMIPALFITLDEMPLTPSGKIDRRALPAPDHRRPELEKGFTAPRNPIEEKLCEIWADLLDLEQVGIHDNFFEMGGHSLLATKITSQIQKTMNLEMPLQVIFEHPTIARQAEYLHDISITMHRDKFAPKTLAGSREDFIF